MLSGRTRQGKLVHFAPLKGAGVAPGSFVNVRVERAAPHHLAGSLVSVEPGPGRRAGQRIQVVAG